MTSSVIFLFPVQGRIQKIHKEGAEETDDAVLHHAGSICDQTLGLTLRIFQKYMPPPLPKSAHAVYRCKTFQFNGRSLYSMSNSMQG